MLQIVRHGAKIDAVTAKEVGELLASNRAATPTRIRAMETVTLDATGAGQDEIYTVPPGHMFMLRRLFLNLSTAADPVTGAVALNVAGKYVSLLRSGTLIEYLVPLAPTAAAQVPGVETWSSEEGPIIANGEVLECKAVGLTANATLSASIQGLLYKGERSATG